MKKDTEKWLVWGLRALMLAAVLFLVLTPTCAYLFGVVPWAR